MSSYSQGFRPALYITNKKEEKTVVNYEELFETAQKHPDQEKTENIGIAEDGSAVNLDLWIYTKNEEGDSYALNKPSGSFFEPGYIGEVNKETGEIEGKVPMFIKEGDGEFYPVTSMNGTFCMCTDLIIAPEIPSTVRSMWATFANCENLKIASSLPEYVEDIRDIFNRCSNLILGPEIIPETVIWMSYAFADCTNLMGTIQIEDRYNSYVSFDRCFYNAGAGVGRQVTLVATGENVSFITGLAGTSNEGNVLPGR